MATKKKYANNVDTGARHHYDVYELTFGGDAVHIAPFTQEYEAARVSTALAALDVVNEEEFTSVYVVRARPTVAHNIHKHHAKEVKRNAAYISALRKRLFATLDMQDEPTKTAVVDEPAQEEAPKKRRILKKKVKA